MKYLFSRLERVWWILTSFRNPLRVLAIYLCLYKQGEDVVLELRNGAKCKLDPNNLTLGFHLFREVWAEEAYGRPQDSLPSDAVIIDIGAHIGTFTVFVARSVSDAKVYCYEPDPDNFALLQENIRMNNLEDRVRAFQCAVSDEDGTVKLYRSHLAPSRHSLIQDDFLQTEDNDYVTVEAKSLRSIFDELGIGRCDLLKIDCEGAEYAILGGAGRDVLGKVGSLVMEYHDGVGGGSLAQLTGLLEDNGYTTETIPNAEVKNLGILRAHRGSHTSNP